MRKIISFLIVFLLLSGTMFAQWQKVTLRLQEKLDETTRDQYVRTLVVFQDQVDIVSMDEQFYAEKASIEKRTYEVITTLQAKARQTQGDLLGFLAEKEAVDDVFTYDPFWIVNMVMVEAKPEVIYEIAERGDISFIDLDARLEYDRPVHAPIPANRATESVEAGVKIINADKLWAMGITGEGRLIMGIDTGVDVNHPALNYKWHGNSVPADQAWFDPSSGTTSPNDCDGHGTHTMGTMTGLVEGDTVGVAIGAEWIASNSLCGGGSHTSRSIASFEWAMDPDGNPNTINDMPDAITNSWYDPSISNDCNSVYKATLDAVEAVGIAPIFSAGNSGPGSSTITSPKNINTNTVNIWSTAAIDGSQYLSGSTTPIASFSSRGPSSCGGTGSLLIKPEAAAPGVNVRSSYAGGGYTQLSGTSMAAPHVAGAVTLLRQFAPQLTGKQIKEALYATAKDLGTPGEDNDYGMGLIDVYAAFLTLGTPDDTPPDPIVDLTAGEPTSSSLVLSWTVPEDTSQNGVTGYDIRISETMISDTNDFNAATQLTFVGTPKPFGATETFAVNDLSFSTTYYFAVRCMDLWGNVSDLSNVATGTTYDAPEIAVTPAEVSIALDPGQTTSENMNVANVSATNSTLDFNIEMANNTFPEDMVQVKLVPKKSAIEAAQSTKDDPAQTGGVAIEGFGGPDTFGYEWIDSDEANGPDYVWNDISGSGTAITNWTPTGTFSALDEGYAGPIDIGFDFKFYNELYNEIYFGSNGFVSFQSITGNTYSNAQIPSSSTPNALISAIWDDLDGGNGGTVYYESFNDKFVVQYDNWGEYFGSGTFTYQVVLHKSGKVMIYYNSMTGDLSSSTVGIENHNGDDGLQVAYNASYISNEKAIQFTAEPDWLALSNNAGMLYNGNDMNIELSFMTEDYPQGTYTMDIIVHSNDPVNGEIVVPVTMVLGEGGGATDWSADLNVMDAGGTETAMDLTFGMNALATDGIDSDLGEYELPPVPPAGVFDARFVLPNNAPSPIDYRGINNTEIVWKVKFQPSSGGYPFTLSWNPSDLPDGSFMLTDALGGLVVSVNMKSENSVEVTNTSVNELHITYSEMMMVEMGVNQGWNIVSMPLHGSDMTVSSVFPDAASPAYAFQNGYVTVDEFAMGAGYWLKFDEAGSHEVWGQSVSMPVDVAQGWNIVGPFDQSVSVDGISSTPAGIVSSVFYGFNNGYSIAEELMPGKGYWVKASEAGTLNYGAAPKKDPGVTLENPLSNLASISVMDADGYRQVLYLGKVSGLYELPPVPPAGVADVRFSNNSLVSELSGAELKLNSVKFPIRISSNGAELKLTDLVGGDLVNAILKSGESVTISDSRISSLSVSSVEMPEEFALEQNYPNPFNPSTTISFALPLHSTVEIRVFDMLGQQVMTTGSKSYEAGTHKVQIDASQLSSGMYLYTITANAADGNKFIDTRKMMLMK